MSIRRDKIQLDVEINGQKAGKSYKELINDSRNLKRELLALTPGTDAFIKKSAELQKVNARLAEIRRQTRGVQTESRSLIGTFKKFLPAIGVAGIIAGIARAGRALFNLGRESLNFFNVQAKADAQLRAGLESTRGAAGRTFEQLKKQASDLQKITLFGDEQIQQAQSILLTFTKVEDSIYDQAIPAILDMSTKLDVDLKSASIQVGKALNDPIKGVTALSRAGVQFSDDQKKVIKRLQETGDIAGAQTIILKELETQFAGSAEAAGGAGLGAYTKLKNRLSDVKETMGQLIVRGLNRLAPALTGIVSFVEKFVAVAVSGDKATGKFSTGVNVLIGVFKFLAGTIRIATIPLRQMWQVVTGITVAVVTMYQKASQLSGIGPLLKVLVAPLRLIYDLVTETGASFAGLRAAVEVAVDNIKNYFAGLVNAAQIMKLKLQRSLSISQATKDRLTQEIKDLQSLKTAAAQSGQTVGEAYAQARDKAILANKVADDNAVPTAFGSAPVVPGSVPASAGIPKSKATADKKKKAVDATKAAIDQLKAEGKAKLEELKIQLSLEMLTEEEHATQVLAARKENLKLQLDTLASHGKLQTSEYRQTLIEQLQLIKEGSEQKVQAQIAELEKAGAGELTELQTRFLNQLLTEQEFEEQALQKKEEHLQRKIALLTELGLQETDAFRKTQKEQLDVQKDIDAKKVENAERTAELKAKVAGASKQIALETLNFAIEILGKDKAARRKHASAIKAFQIAQVAVNSAAEIQGYWKNNAQQLPTYIAIPLSIAQTAAAVARAVSQTNKIRKQKFYRGGYIPGQGGPTGDTGTFHDGQDYVADVDVHVGEHVTPKWQVRHPVYGKVVKWLDAGRKGQLRTSFMDGGFVGGNVSTDPVGIANLPLAQREPTTGPDLNSLLSKMDQVMTVMLQPRKLKAEVAIGDIEDAAGQLNEIRNTAGF